MPNIANINNCYGCGVCALSCPPKIIDITLNKKGFLKPEIKAPDKCINCSLCLNVCSYSHNDYALQSCTYKCYASWSKNEKIRRASSSGGIAFEIALRGIELGYKICAVRYNADKNIAEHYIASNLSELQDSIGSKYIQSHTLKGFKGIDFNEKYIVFGSPCQIDSLRRYIQKIKKNENFIFVDFFCHGVPSYLLWEKYSKGIEKNIGKIKRAFWRNKDYGWHKSLAMKLIGEKNSYYSQFSEQDPFLKAFLLNMCLSDACYDSCRFKMENSSADIRIGDLWGSTYNTNDLGVSGVISYTQQGMSLLESSNIHLENIPFEIVTEGQMKNNPSRPSIYKKINNILQDNDSDLSKLTKAINHRSLSTKVKYRLKNLLKK